MKKNLCWLVVLTIIVSTIAVLPLSSSADDNYDMLMKFNGYSRKATLLDGTVTDTCAEAGVFVSGAIKYGLLNDKQKGTDAIIRVTDTGAGADKGVNGKTIFNIPKITFYTKTNPIGANAEGTYKYLVYEFDVLFATEDSSITILYGGNGAGGRSAALIAASQTPCDKIITEGSDDNTYIKNLTYGTAFYGNIGTNHWTRVRVSFPIAGQVDDSNIRILANDVVTTKQMITPSGNKVMAAKNFTGVATDNMNGFGFFCYDDKTNETYLDNITVYGTKSDSNDITSFIPQDPTPQVTVNTANGLELIGNDITVPQGTTVANLISNLTPNSTSKVFGVYESTLTTKKADTDTVSDNDVVVVTDTGRFGDKTTIGLYNYYSVFTEEAQPEMTISNLAIPQADNSSVKITYDYSNTFSDEKTMKVVVALYNINKELIGVNIEDLVVPAGTDSGEKTLTVTAKGTISYAKAFVLNNLTSLMPYCSSAIKNY